MRTIQIVQPDVVFYQPFYYSSALVTNEGISISILIGEKKPHISEFCLLYFAKMSSNHNNFQHHKLYYKACDYKVATFKSNNIHDRSDDDDDDDIKKVISNFGNEVKLQKDFCITPIHTISTYIT